MAHLPLNSVMPYIKPEDRKKLDPAIDALVKKLAANNFNEGELNYALEPVLKFAGGLRRGILAVAKAASSEHPRSGL